MPQLRSTPKYRFFSTDILTGTVQAELPLYGVWLTRKLCEAGSGTGTYKLGTGLFNDAELLKGTTPGKTAMFVERDGTIIWGGPIWSRTWAEDSKTINLTAQTYESIFEHVALEQDFVKQGIDQMQIFKDMIDAIQNQAHNDFGIETDEMPVVSGVNRTVLIPGYEFHMASDVVEQTVNVEEGFDYTIDLLPGVLPDTVRKVVRAGYPQLGSREQSNMAVYDFPGNIANFWWPESATRSGVKFAALGKGEGLGAPRIVRFNARLLNDGYPGWWYVKAWKGVDQVSQLDELLGEEMRIYSTPVSAPTFELKSDEVPTFDRWNDLGAQFVVRIESDRFPDGMEVATRMIGWELNIADADQSEMLKFTVEGDRDAE
jgi:hypothetical protein